MPAKAKKDTTKVVPQKVQSSRSKSIPKSKKVEEVKQALPLDNRATHSKKAPAATSRARRSKSVAAEYIESEDGPIESDAVFKQNSFVAFISKTAVESGEQEITIGKVSI